MFEFKKMEEKDLNFFIDIRNECKDNLHDNSHYTIEECKKWFIEKNPVFFIIKYNKKNIGYFRTSNWDIENGLVSIGADIHKNYRGNGYAKEAYRLFINILNNEYNIKFLFLEVLSNNSIAIKLYKKLGFTQFSKRFHRNNTKGKIYSISMFKIIGNI